MGERSNVNELEMPFSPIGGGGGGGRVLVDEGKCSSKVAPAMFIELLTRHNLARNDQCFRGFIVRSLEAYLSTVQSYSSRLV